MKRMRTPVQSPETLPARGNYTLVIRLKSPSLIRIAKKGQFNFQEGCYVYTGSALGNSAISLRHRVARHLRKRKELHWHIDYLLADAKASILAVVAGASKANRECEITNLIQRIERASLPIIGFGASDCRRNCKSHLVYFEKGVKLERIAQTYRGKLGNAHTLRIIAQP